MPRRVRRLRRLRPVGLAYADHAPVRLVFAAEIASPPAAVYAALAEDVEGASRWVTGVSRARSTAGGKGREVTLSGGFRLVETVLAAEPDEQYAYRVDGTNLPGPRTLLEDWRLTPAGGGTRIRWTFATDGPVAYRFLMLLARPGMGRAFRASVRALDRRLAGR
ncbi:SRPBCC family protein [Streptomyces sp. NPDC052496]|uniref:SRPBCC family protein n=1 Tax=Streptomyces sp. NPDC052496 TaxID=3154951 RepID=UPI00343B1E96